jgi:hypothetical protein
MYERLYTLGSSVEVVDCVVGGVLLLLDKSGKKRKRKAGREIEGAERLKRGARRRKVCVCVFDLFVDKALFC